MPLVADLLTLWEGVSFSTYNSGTQLIRCALLCVACDLPAARKACGFLSHSANQGDTVTLELEYLENKIVLVLTRQHGCHVPTNSTEVI